VAFVVATKHHLRAEGGVHHDDLRGELMFVHISTGTTLMIQISYLLDWQGRRFAISSPKLLLPPQLLAQALSLHPLLLALPGSRTRNQRLEKIRDRYCPLSKVLSRTTPIDPLPPNSSLAPVSSETQ
jgi:hypothetical protein